MPSRSAIRLRDPFILPLPSQRRYALFGTTDADPWGAGSGAGFDVYTSADLESWDGPFAAFRPAAGFWADSQFWAPECHVWRGRHHLFASFAQAGRQRGTQILVADDPLGPYREHSQGPVTPRAWDCLDGTLHVDAWGEPWLVFCHEWLQVEDGRMCAVRLSDDLRRPLGEPVELFRASAAAWSRPFAAHGRQANRITDGPYLLRSPGGVLHMLWSSMGAEGYAMGCATSTTGCILGPWRHGEEAVFAKDGGHGMIFQTFDGRALLTLHRPNTSPDERPHWLPVRIRDDGILVG